ncbi:MAG: hypothetical protein F6J93_37110 [Oscillatoria sp. SIO1A7]|nr:hypothetical protein [Oscillatoria sp. SIO1A7]
MPNTQRIAVSATCGKGFAFGSDRHWAKSCPMPNAQCPMPNAHFLFYFY